MGKNIFPKFMFPPLFPASKWSVALFEFSELVIGDFNIYFKYLTLTFKTRVHFTFHCSNRAWFVLYDFKKKTNLTFFF